MSSPESTQSTEERVREAVSLFLQRNFPQIQAHGGDSSITDVDLDEGHVMINLGGACSGCGISPMTTQAIQSRLPNEVDEIDSVSVSTGFDGLPDEQPSFRDGSPAPDAPF
ncbi:MULTISPECIES: NifU family protein [Natrialbaceae]|uniref:NifU family protein n=1 Tax=Natrialbaceae TaxID=1644061 RepID=UPI00207C8DD3|nr:NifU family protein [Natronococcus sp. CG52]